MSATPSPRLALRGNPRLGLALGTLTLLVALVALLIVTPQLAERAGASDFQARLLAPTTDYWFGTDVLGRDLLARTLQGLALSLWVGAAAALLGTLIALGLAALACLDRRADAVVGLLVDSVLGLPHLILLMLIAFALGGGTQAVIIAVALTHWPSLTRVLRAELLQLQQADYVRLSRRFGKSRGFVIWHHLLPALLPHCLVGGLLLFPHAILHEAALTFLGFGLSPGQPAIGVLLAESMRYLSAGYWWLGVFPGLGLLLLVLAFDRLGNALRRLLTPHEAQQ
ncbi:peptide/nickel transport system permease protein [Franzmannia pantelleriensis]|uniref:Peptide/nickel transport system permease protein n=1 Tax=Franzmannia pantelleriensis TaxID=48727 RepID=A0A1G9JSP3_9GAMM|nr:ABC transporter permease [Halomonas pantelleriensis]SDL40194.1 peptide/nickel transport system permease protein [Halomonas pantelleriensis]